MTELPKVFRFPLKQYNAKARWPKLAVLPFEEHQASTTRVSLVAIVVWFEGACLRQTHVLGLLLRQFSEVGLKCWNVEGSHKLVHQFWHQVNICFVSPLWRIEQLYQRKSLCCISDGHNKARDGRAGEIDPPTLSKKHHALATRPDDVVHLGSDFLPDQLLRLEAEHVDLGVAVAHVADNAPVLHLVHVVPGHHVLVAGCRDYDVNALDNLCQLHNLKTIHASLKRTDRVNLSDIDHAPKVFQGLAATLSNLTIPCHKNLFSTKHDVGGALEAVNDGLATGVEVVVLGLDHRVVHIHRRHQQLVALAQLVESVNPCNGFLNNAPHQLEDCWELFHHDMGGVPPIVENHIWLPRLCRNGSLNAPPEVFLALSPPGKDWDPSLSKSSSNLVLGRVDVASSPAHLCAKAAQRLDKDCSLSIDVGAPRSPRLLQWLVFLGFVPQGHDARHFLLRNLNLSTTVHMGRDLAHAEVRTSLAVRLRRVLSRGSLIFVTA